MPKGYVIAHATVTDTDKWGQYVAKANVAMQRYGGARIVSGGKCQVMEGTGTARNVVIEFPDYEAAMGYATSPEYAVAKKLREGAGHLDMTIVEGV